MVWKIFTAQITRRRNNAQLTLKKTYGYTGLKQEARGDTLAIFNQVVSPLQQSVCAKKAI